jgi:hypothetical protein
MFLHHVSTLKTSIPQTDHMEDTKKYITLQILEDLTDKYEGRIKELVSESEERNAALIREAFNQLRTKSVKYKIKSAKWTELTKNCDRFKKPKGRTI